MIAVPANTITLGVNNPSLGLTTAANTATTAPAAPSATKEGLSTLTIILIVLIALLAFFFVWYFARKSERVVPVRS